jgi:ribose/xylose/arabinose/galactoside ABC-type transport system permease subunit
MPASTALRTCAQAAESRKTIVADRSTKPDEAKGRIAFRGTLNWVWTVFGPFLGLILITLLFAAITRESGSFLTLDNWRTIAVQTVIVGTAALGMTIIMIAGGIDLSVGSAVALVTVCIVLFVKKLNPALPEVLHDAKVALPIAMLLGVLLGGLCGAINGALIAGLRVIPFIVTLGSYMVYRGFATWLSSNTTIYLPNEAKPWWFDRILAIQPKPAWLLFAPGVWLLLALSLIVALNLRYSLLGRYVYAVGSNEATARLCGINVPLIKVVVYTLGGLATGLAGLLQFVFLFGSGDPTTAGGMELRVIAAVVIGGGSLSGGEGTVLGTLIGCLIMSVLNNGCVHAGIPNASQDIIIGIIIVAAVTLDRVRRRSGV